MALDPELLKIIQSLDPFTREQLKNYNGDIQQFLREHNRGGDLVETEKLFQRIAGAASLFAGAYAAGLLAKNLIAARKAIDKDNAIIKFNLNNAGARDEAVVPFLRNNRDAAVSRLQDTFLDRNFPGTTVSVSRRLKTVADGSQTVVRQIIQQGIADHKSVFEIGKDIEAYVIPNPNGRRVAPWTVARRQFGKPISYIPRGIPAGSVEFNAYRIAVSETAATFQKAPELANKGKWYVEGYLWVLSRQHPKIDRCDSYAAHDEGIGLGVWRSIPKLPHPHCLCHTQTKVIPAHEMVEWLNRLNWN